MGVTILPHKAVWGLQENVCLGCVRATGKHVAGLCPQCTESRYSVALPCFLTENLLGDHTHPGSCCKGGQWRGIGHPFCCEATASFATHGSVPVLLPAPQGAQSIGPLGRRVVWV